MRCQLKVATHTFGQVAIPPHPLKSEAGGGGWQLEGEGLGYRGGGWKRFCSSLGTLPGRVGRGTGKEGEEPRLAAGRQRTLLPPASQGLV